MARKDPSEFTKKTIDTISKRAGQVCSNPNCQRPTSSAHSKKDKSVIIGKAAHIYGKKPKSARFKADMKPEERGDISNAIWICAGCHDEIDKDEKKYTANLLLKWKAIHEKSIKMKMIAGIGTADIHKNQIDNALLASLEVDVLEDNNIKSAMKAWSDGDIEKALELSHDAYFEGKQKVKLQAIVNIILLSPRDTKKPLYYIGLCDEGIAIAASIGYPSTSSVLKAHKAFFLQHKALMDSLKIYNETVTRFMTGVPRLSTSQILQIEKQAGVDEIKIDELINQAQKEAYASKDYSAIANVKMSVGGTVGLAYFIKKFLGQDTGAIESFTIRALLDAKETYELLGDKEGVGTALHNLANNLRVFGDIKRSKRYAQQALTIAKEIGYKELESKASELLHKKLNTAKKE